MANRIDSFLGAEPQAPRPADEVIVTTADEQVRRQQALFDALNAPPDNQPFDSEEL